MRKRIRYSVVVLIVIGGTVFATAPRAAHYRHRSARVNGAVFSPDGSRFATWDQNTLRIYDTGSTRDRAALPPTAYHFDFSWDAKLIVSGSEGKELAVRSADNGSELFRLPHFPERVAEIACNRSGTLAVGCSDGIVHLYEFSTGKSAGSIRADGSGLRRLALSPDGRQLVSCGQDGLCFWDVVTRTRRHALPVNLFTWRLAFSPDGSVLCAFGPGGCRLYDVATAVELPCERPDWFEGGDWASALAFNPDGRTLLAANESVAGLWDVRTGANTHRFPKRSGEMFLRFSDRFLLSSDLLDTNPCLEAGTITAKGDVMMLATRRNAVVVWRLASVGVR